MARVQLKLVNDPVLRRIAKPVLKVNKRTKNILDTMARVMAEHNGVGLAGPQVGISRRLIVVDVGEGVIRLVNPELVRADGSEIEMEGCLSIPGVFGQVERAYEVEVTGLDENGHRVWIEGKGLLARALQHELDHLDGVLFIDKAIRLIDARELEKERRSESKTGKEAKEEGKGRANVQVQEDQDSIHG